ncbi:hypothetical protein WCN79_01530 [Xanthomonas axonopodis pv. vasculorum]|uniref:Uncharacterized protein n=1 Tax=Xanthomonas axonopodis pv. vasculorum TaxID=325777 RepID=A0A098Q483_9XANT|nr:hypothetical protein [Xanthomonas axonopodis]KGE53718.1 hypothetical protein GW15_0200285 [Xanthomonas axonopodis pv. vasculorum]PPV10270.1 hypothetical protein XavaCFBP5823_09360 [Xanthomonas axonopodis pv. vasculorum]QKD85194.1 hypothetical protein XAV_00130 [Xanthomonas axonopodis pv. vasculorum]
MKPQILLLALTLVCTSAWADENVSKVNGRISADAGKTYGALETVNGSIEIGAGAQTKNVETVNGGIRIGDNARTGGVETVNGSIGLVGTELGKGIETVNGDITVGVGSHVRGGIEVSKPSFGFSFQPSRKPRVVIGPGAVVDGPSHFEREVNLYVHRSAKIGAVSGATARSFDSDVAPKD